MITKGTFLRAAIRARKRTLVHHHADTLCAEKIGALSDPEHVNHSDSFCIIIIIIIISHLYSAYYKKKNIGATVKIKNKL